MVARTEHGWTLGVALIVGLVTGCSIETPIVITQSAQDSLAECGYCAGPISGDGEVDPVEGQVDTLVVTIYRLANEVDCRSCVELGECEVDQRECICLDPARPLGGVDLGVELASLELQDGSRDEEYCVAVAQLRTDGAAGPGCECAPETWELPQRSVLGCTYSRRAKSPGSDALLLNQTVCQNPVSTSGVFLPPPDPNGDMSGREPGWTCIYADFFSESLRSCAGVHAR